MPRVSRHTQHAPCHLSPCNAGFASKQRHTSTHRGVSWHTQTQRWKAQIKVNGKDVNLGRHKEEELAARAYDR